MMIDSQSQLSNRNDRTASEKRTRKACSFSCNTVDYWTIFLAFIVIIPCLFFYITDELEGVKERNSWKDAVMKVERANIPFRSVAWYKAFDDKKEIRASDGRFGSFLKKWLSKPHKWKDNPCEAFSLNKTQTFTKNETKKSDYEKARANAEIMKALALVAEKKAKKAAFKDAAVNKDAQQRIKQWRQARWKEANARKNIGNKSYNIIPGLLGIMLFSGLFFALPIYCMGQNPLQFLVGFFPVFLLSVFSYMLAAQTVMRHYGIGYAVWGIITGMLISNTIGTPRWVKPGLRIELYTKTALVLLGAEIILTKVMAIGVPGFLIAWVGAPVVLLTSFWFGRNILKIESDTLNLVISADLSICGTSAAIATAAACRAKEEELTFAIGLSLVFTAAMMVLMPMFINAISMNEVLAGAWLGGSIDATGAVASAGALVSERALDVAVTVKMIQNILIGAVAFCVAVYWAVRVETKENKNVAVMEIWQRFPKFIIGFTVAMLLFSFLSHKVGNDIAYSLFDQGVIRGGTGLFRGWFFCFSFVAIGLQCDFRILKKYFKGGKTLLLYLFGQSLQLLVSLLLAYLAFFVFFPDNLSNL